MKLHSKSVQGVKLKSFFFLDNQIAVEVCGQYLAVSQAEIRFVKIFM